jgi:hypothetical protein
MNLYPLWALMQEYSILLQFDSSGNINYMVPNANYHMTGIKGYVNPDFFQTDLNWNIPLGTHSLSHLKNSGILSRLYSTSMDDGQHTGELLRLNRDISLIIFETILTLRLIQDLKSFIGWNL